MAGVVPVALYGELSTIVERSPALAAANGGTVAAREDGVGSGVCGVGGIGAGL